VLNQKKVCVLCDFDLDEWAGEEHPSKWPYGMDQLEESGSFSLFQPGQSRRRRMKQRPAATVRDANGSSLGQKLVRGTDLIAALGKADAVLSVFEPQGDDYRRLARFRKLPPLVVMSCWLAQSVLTNDQSQFERLKRLSELSAVLTVFSENQVPIITTALGTPRAKIHVVTFGIETSFYSPRGDDEDYVAVIGNDVGRDWPTFLAAAALTPHVRYRVASTRKISEAPVPSNVDLLGVLDHVAYRDLMRHASVIVVPSYPLAYPTGQSVLLEGYACGRPAITARTPAMTAYAIPEACLTYEPGDAASLATAVTDLINDQQRREEMGRAARKAAEQLFDSRRMWREVGDLVSRVC
jgi:glycosyltransferase involved in cell wall biosynthesis